MLKVIANMDTPTEKPPIKEPVKASAMSKQSIITSVLALVIGVAAVLGFYYYLDSLTPKGDPKFEKRPATEEENVKPTGAMPQAPGA